MVRRFYHRGLAIYKLYVCNSDTDDWKVTEHYADRSEAAFNPKKVYHFGRDHICLLL